MRPCPANSREEAVTVVVVYKCYYWCLSVGVAPKTSQIQGVMVGYGTTVCAVIQHNTTLSVRYPFLQQFDKYNLLINHCKIIELM